MRAHASLTILCLAGLAGAQDGLLGTKASAIAAPTSSGGGMGVMPLIQMALALGVVMLLLKFVLPRMVGKMNKKLTTNTTGGLQIEESATFAGGTLYVVRARTKTLLLSVSTQGVNCLADITEPEVKTEPDFEDLVQQAPGDKAPVVEEPIVEAPQSAVIETALERLARLAG